MDKKILIFSNSPAAGTGYGNQTNLWCATLPNYGFKLGIVCSYGLEGHTVDLHPMVKLYPGGNNSPTRDDIMPWVVRDFDPDVILSLLDVWALNFPGDPDIDVPWVPWTPVDTEPLPDRIIEKLKLAEGIVAYSKFGQRTINDTGLEAHYIPHGVATDVFVPKDKTKCREELGIPDGRFVVGMVAHNAFHPSRKSIAETLTAFSSFHQRHPDSLLYLHMLATEERQGIDLESLQNDLGIGHAVYWVHQGGVRIGLPVGHMVTTYNSFDILVNPSLGEGFGIPIMKAQSCGVPVIANNCTSMTELVGEAGGWLVRGQPYRTVMKTWWSQPLVDSIDRALETAYQSWSNQSEWKDRRYTARTFAEKYDFVKYIGPMWEEYLTERWF